ncbi:MAG: aminotransferase class IV [Bacteroidota bacterium]
MEHFDFQYINGKLVKEGDPLIFASDSGFLRSFSIFDYFNLIEGIPVFLEDHLDRFFCSAKQVGLKVPYTRPEIKDAIFQFLDVNDVKNGGVRLVLTGGVPDRISRKETPNFIIQGAFLVVLPQSAYTDGVSLITHEYLREFPEVKTTNYMMWKSLSSKIDSARALDVLYHLNGNISETSRGNFFLVTADNLVVTPRDKILKGITRKYALTLAKDQFEVEERDVSLSELSSANEAFLTSSSKSILPVVKIGDTIIGDGKPGAVTHSLMRLYKKQVSKELINFKESII